MADRQRSFYGAFLAPAGRPDICALSEAEGLLIEQAQGLVQEVLQETNDARLAAAGAILDGVLNDTEGDG